MSSVRFSALGSRLSAPAAFDLVIGGEPRFGPEAPWAWRLLSRYSRDLPAARRTETRGRAPRVADARGDSPIVLVQADAEAFVLPEVGGRLVSRLDARPEVSVVLPVSNEARTEEARAAPPFSYSTPTLLREATASLAAGAAELRVAAAPDSPVYAVRRSALSKLAPDLPLERVPELLHAGGGVAVIDPGAYVHRYGAMDASAREDLAAKLPAGATAVLDVGCSRGATARALRARGVTRIVGIEPDAEDAAEAARVYDRVVATTLEAVSTTALEAVSAAAPGAVSEDWSREFDAVLFGDVLEHLEDPSAALLRVRPWLKPGGVVIASVPNVGHWSIVDDLLRGRFDYVPYSLLSGTHIRFFTRRTLVDVFEASGYRVEEIATLDLPASPEGRARLARLRSFPGASEDLEVAEFLAVARGIG